MSFEFSLFLTTYPDADDFPVHMFSYIQEEVSQNIQPLNTYHNSYDSCLLATVLPLDRIHVLPYK